MNAKTRAGSSRSPVRTRPRLFLESRAPRATGHFPDAVAATRAAHRLSARHSAAPRRDPAARPTTGWPGPRAQTRDSTPPAIGHPELSAPSPAGTPPDTLDGIVVSPSSTPSDPP